MNKEAARKCQALLKCVNQIKWEDENLNNYSSNLYRRGLDSIHDRIFELTQKASGVLDEHYPDNDMLISMYHDMIMHASAALSVLNEDEKCNEVSTPEFVEFVSNTTPTANSVAFSLPDEDRPNVNEASMDVDRIAQEIDDITNGRAVMSKNARRGSQ